ncbi:MAG: hypothetical protein KF725_05300 [Cyclobacteriaceae bacterium]|nr:hypothetical protein [Cyclobacteriaceae bacterium]UYN85891.1 MAG: hypothetical protein KIT51_13580 [Cyclobacteriaceae bacterium]
MMSKIRFTILFLLMSPCSIQAQCAMCRTQLENNVSNGDVGIAAGINTGILYLLSLPYLAILVLGYVWYRNSRKNVIKLRQGPVAG